MKALSKLAVLIVVLMPTLGLVMWFMIGDLSNGGMVAMYAALVWVASYLVVSSTDWSSVK